MAVSTLPVTQRRDVIHLEAGVQIAFASWVPAEPRAVVLLCHGHCEHLGRYAHVIAALIADGWAVYGPDHRGHGRSTGTRALIPDFDRVADDLHVLAIHARHAHPDLPVALIGHSMGGLIAARYALKHQDTLAALVVSGSALVITDPLSVGRERLLRTVARLAPTAPTPRGGGSGQCSLSSEAWVCERFGIDHRTWHGSTRIATAVGMVDRGADTLARAGEFRVPLLAMHGADDTLTRPVGTETLHERASSPDKALILWEGRRHEIFNAPGRDVVLDTMRQWLGQRLGTTGDIAFVSP